MAVIVGEMSRSLPLVAENWSKIENRRRCLSESQARGGSWSAEEKHENFGRFRDDEEKRRQETRSIQCLSLSQSLSSPTSEFHVSNRVRSVLELATRKMADYRVEVGFGVQQGQRYGQCKVRERGRAWAMCEGCFE